MPETVIPHNTGMFWNATVEAGTQCVRVIVIPNEPRKIWPLQNLEHIHLRLCHDNQPDSLLKWKLTSCDPSCSHFDVKIRTKWTPHGIYNSGNERVSEKKDYEPYYTIALTDVVQQASVSSKTRRTRPMTSNGNNVPQSVCIYSFTNNENYRKESCKRYVP